MRLLTNISIATLATSISALLLVLIMIVTEPWESEESVHERENTQELTETMVRYAIKNHASDLIKSAGVTEDSPSEEWRLLPGYGWFWIRQTSETEQKLTRYPLAHPASELLTYNYIKQDDIWLVTSDFMGLEREIKTWMIDDNTGKVTYGRPGD